MSRQVVLDTETTGLDPASGHRIIEIACVEMVNRRLTQNNFFRRVHPEREIDKGATDVHGIMLEDLAHEPKFAEIADEFLSYVAGAELIIHNAPFDVGFLNVASARRRPRRPACRPSARTPACCRPVSARSARLNSTVNGSSSAAWTFAGCRATPRAAPGLTSPPTIP